MRHRIVEVGIGHGSESIGKHHLFYQTREDKDDSTLNHNRGRGLPELDLRDELPGTNNRTRDKMREKCNEERVIDDVSDGLHFSPIDVKRIRKTGKRVKADPDRKNNL